MISNNVYLAAQFKEIDENCGFDTDTLMQNAAKKLFDILKAEGRHKDNIYIVCGKGNNGGDGYALACILKNAGLRVAVCAVDKPTSPLAIKYHKLYVESKGQFCNIKLIEPGGADTVVDCMFGFSFKGELRGEYARAAEAINKSGAFVIAADLPSGLYADSDERPPLAVKADITCSFTAYKCALLSNPAKELCGKVIIADIGIPEEILNRFTPYAYTDCKKFISELPKRQDNSHKGSYGPLVALCGNEDMSGAAFLACNAAYRTGTGLVKLYTHKNAALPLKTMLPEAIIKEAINADTLINEKCKALLIGCGCGRSYDHIITEVLKHISTATVLDADGINCIAGNIELYKSVSCPLIITPHPAEMARLMEVSTDEVNASRIKHTKNFAEAYGFVTVLKGNATVIAAPDGSLYINRTGNSGLAKGGSGDVLAGIIASLCAQGAEPFVAAALGVYIHGAAADRLLKTKGAYAMMPSELAEEAGKILYFG
ncbi:MAG: NAD(P)H-hydrate dehydratase [Ruminococcaceae bacterium]|nr:NAD(P)H-hydrate dehydratase [Oscillospiraceae bacterium]